MSTSAMTAPSIWLSGSRYGRTRNRYQRPSSPWTSNSRVASVVTTSVSCRGRSVMLNFSLMSPIGRPMSAPIRLKSFSAMGVKRRMRRSRHTMTIATCTLLNRLMRSLLRRLNSSLLFCSSWLTVVSSSLLD